MAASKTSTTLTASGTLTAGTPITSSALSLATTDFCTLVALVTNGATGPTLPAIWTVQLSTDGGTTYYNIPIGTAGTTASTTYYFVYDIPAGIQSVKSNFSGNTAQNCTVECQASSGNW